MPKALGSHITKSGKNEIKNITTISDNINGHASFTSSSIGTFDISDDINKTNPIGGVTSPIVTFTLITTPK